MKEKPVLNLAVTFILDSPLHLLKKIKDYKQKKYMIQKYNKKTIIQQKG